MKTNAILLMDPGTHTAYFQNRNLKEVQRIKLSKTTEKVT